MPSNLTDYQHLAVSAAKKSVAELIRYRNQYPLVPCWKKPDSSYVTPADYAVQYYLFKTLHQAFPNIPFIGEETLEEKDSYKLPYILHLAQQLDPKATQQDLLIGLRSSPFPSTLFWLVDPIDGTAGFIKNRFFAIAISLIYESQPILSIIACPTMLQNSFKVYFAAKEHGAYLFDSDTGATSRLQAGKICTNRFCEASLSARNQKHWATQNLSNHLPTNPSAYRVDSQYKYALVAENSVDFFIRLPFSASKAYSWDHAPGAFLVEEAGGIVSDLSGAALNYRNDTLTLQNHPVLLASGNKAAHEMILQTLYERLYSSEQTKMLIEKA